MAGALITGAGRRVGRVLAETLAADGYDLTLHHRTAATETEALAARLAADHGVRCVALQADLGVAAEAAGLVGEAVEAIGDIRLLVNNASLFDPDTLATLEASRWEAHMAVNLRAPLLLSRGLADHLAPEATGHIVNMLDQRVANLQPDYLSYTLSKATLAAATELLAKELAPRVRVNGIAPGLTLPSGGQTDAEFARAQAASLLGCNATPEQLAGALTYLDHTPAVTGQILFVDGGDRFRPASVRRVSVPETR